MFTGLVQQVGQLHQLSFQGEAGRLAISARFDSPLQIGESVAINGACLTLVEQNGEKLVFDVLRETFDKTSLRDKAPGSPLNLERALRMGDPLGGHLVSGHVDGTGELRRIETAGRDKVLVVSAPELVADIVPKGSISIDGVSLTVVEVNPADGTFSVHVIPHTWSQTALASLSAGSRVNLETDMLGKYVRAALRRTETQSPVTWEALRNAGYLS
ncbi:MAG TPA: riboflavin synthase [Verrucomicrobia bacterium]|nr:riboflavin synthase [Verrucomicrobiota bacterium]